MIGAADESWPAGQMSYYIAVQRLSWLDDNESKKVAYKITILWIEIHRLYRFI